MDLKQQNPRGVAPIRIVKSGVRIFLSFFFFFSSLFTESREKEREEIGDCRLAESLNFFIFIPCLP